MIGDMTLQVPQQPGPPITQRVAPFRATSTVIAIAAVVVLTQFHGAIPLFAPIQAEFVVDAGAIAWVQTAFGIAYAVGFIAWGPLVDRRGPRQIMLIGLIVLIAMTIAIPFAPSFIWLIVGRVVQGVFAASFAPAAFSYLGTRLAPVRRVLSITVLTSSFLAAAVIGQVLAQIITDRFTWEWFFWIGALALALVAVLIRVVLFADLRTANPTLNPAKAIGELLARVPILVLLIATMMVLSPMIALYTTVGATGLTDSRTLLLLRASALPALIWAPFGTRWLSRFTPLRRLVASFLIAGGAAAAIALVPGNVTGIGVAMFILAAAVAVSAPAMFQTLSEYGQKTQGSVTALYTCFLFLGASIAPTIVTTAGASLTVTALAGGVASLMAAGLVLLAHAHRAQN